MLATLSLSYAYDSDPSESFGRLTVAVDAGGFAGQGSMWVQWQDLRRLAAELLAFPLQPVAFRRGFNDLRGDDLRVALDFTPANPRGELGVTVTVADYLEPGRRLTTDFLTHYPQLERFSRSLTLVMDRKAELARLEGFSET